MNVLFATPCYISAVTMNDVAIQYVAEKVSQFADSDGFIEVADARPASW